MRQDVAVKLLVTGGRDFVDQALLTAVLDKLHAKHDFTHLIHGAARGADTLADQWAVSQGVQPVACRALWEYYARSAGPMRNSAMLKLKPDLVLVFPGGKGTLGMAAMAADQHFEIVRALDVT